MRVWAARSPKEGPPDAPLREPPPHWDLPFLWALSGANRGRASIYRWSW
jgi:hypothetical protein